jgi:hypothetical protein
MFSLLVKWAFKTVLGRYVTAGLVTLLLGSGVWKWYDFKDDLREEGVEECVQEINRATVDALELELKNAQRANEILAEELEFANQVNASALARRQELETSITALAAAMEKQKNEDPNYRDWTNTALPAGVSDRLRQAAGSPPGNND